MLRPNVERAMCVKCDTLRRDIAIARRASTELTDPISVALVKADIKLLEKELGILVADHQAE